MIEGEVAIEAPVTGSVRSVDAVDDYVDHLLAIVDGSSIGPLRVAVDGGNGMAGVTTEKVFARLEATLDGLYLEPDGTFPTTRLIPSARELEGPDRDGCRRGTT